MPNVRPRHALAACANVALTAAAHAGPGAGAIPPDFAGSMLLYAADADMEASAYVDGRLGPRAGVDALGVIRLGDDPSHVEVPASNSVAGPPLVVAASPDGRWAFVIETWTPRPETGETPDAEHTFADLRHAATLRVFDLGDPTAPRLAHTVETAERPDAISVSPDGRTLAIAFEPNGAGAETPLGLYPVDPATGAVGTPAFPDVTAVVPRGERVIHAEWHPIEPILALVNQTAAELALVRVDGSTVTPWGNAVQIEKEPFMARFTPDGRHVLINALYWGADVQGRWNEAPRGTILSVRLAAETRADGVVRHAFVSREIVGGSPEGFAVSPDGTLVAAADMERSWLPEGDPRQTRYSAITLLSLNPETGVLRTLDNQTFDGVLPEALAFDAESDDLAVVVYDRFGGFDGHNAGRVDFWKIVEDPLRPGKRLVRLEHGLDTTRGAHAMVLVP